VVASALACALSARGARAECWSFAITEDPLGAAPDGTIVLMTHRESNAGSPDEVGFEILAPDGRSLASIEGETCGDCAAGASSATKWTISGDAAITAPVRIDDAPSAAVVRARVVAALGLVRPRATGLAVRVSGDDGQRIVTAGKRVLLDRYNWHPIEQPRYTAHLLDAPRAAFLLLAMTSKDSCSHGQTTETMLQTWTVLVPRGRLGARALLVAGQRAAARHRWPVAIAKLTAAVRDDPRDLGLRRALTEVLVAAGGDWPTAKAALEVPMPATAHSPCLGGHELSAMAVEAASARWPEYDAWLASQVVTCE
jgi:hypothetical protein